jgi:hypothetical protein
MNVVWRDTTQFLGIEGWRRRAKYREERTHLLRDARAQKGL